MHTHRRERSGRYPISEVNSFVSVVEMLVSGSKSKETAAMKPEVFIEARELKVMPGRLGQCQFR